MLFLYIAVILAAAFFASAGILLLVAKMFGVKDLKYAKSLKVTLLLLLVELIPVLGLKAPAIEPLLLIAGFVLMLFIYVKQLRIGWGKAFGIYIVSGVLGVIVTVPVVLSLHNFTFRAFRDEGSSMAPTINNNDYLITSEAEVSTAKATGKEYVPKRGQIIIFHYTKDPQNPNLVFIKRVIGLPGDRVVVKDGKITVYNTSNPSGFDPDTSYGLANADTLGDFDQVVPQDSVFVVGDNRKPQGSFDSRDFGFLKTSDIISVVKYRITPTFTTY